LKWDLCAKNLVLSDNNLKVTRPAGKGSNSRNATVIGNIGVQSGTHTWKFRVESPITGNTDSTAVYWVCLGVTTESLTKDIEKSDTYHIPGETFSYCTCGGEMYRNFDKKISGKNTSTGPGSILTMTLDCDNGTLAFHSSMSNSEILKIEVPAKTKLFPFAHLYYRNNSVTIIH